MAKYLLDTNIILRFCNPSDVQHTLVTDAIIGLLAKGDECYLAPQVLIEMWVVATRPTDVNGLGWTPTYTRQVIDDLLERFPLAEELPQLFQIWLDLVTDYNVKGKRTHDMRIVALLRAAQIDYILTLNSGDFSDIAHTVTAHPQDVY